MAKVSWQRAIQIAQAYQTSNDTLTARDTQGNAVVLKSWYIDRQTIIDLMNAVPNCSGLRVYPVWQDENPAGQSIPPYHSLVVLGTQLNTQNGKHDNYKPQDGLVDDYVGPCPSNCPSKNELE